MTTMTGRSSALFIGILLTLSSCTSLASALEHVVVIDAGSSGSRVHVFEAGWTEGEQYPTLVLPQPTLKEKPGLSSFANNPSAAGDSLKGLIAFAESKIPEESWKSTTILIGATAGLRMIPEAKAEAILEDVTDFIKTKTSFILAKGFPQILPGTLEGSLGWLAANFLGGHLKAGTSLAVIEMGGASAQVTVRVPSSSNMPTFPLQLGKDTVSLYTHSYLEYGQEAARVRYNKLLGTEPVIQDACLPAGFNRVKGKAKGPYTGPDESEVTGGGDFEQCYKDVDSLFDTDAPCSYKSCSFDGVASPVLGDGPILTFENFFYTGSALGLEGTGTVDELKKAAAEYCAKNWNDIKSTMSADNSEEDLEKYCFGGAYQAAFLSTGLKIPANKKLMVTNKFDGQSIDWALGLGLQFLMAQQSGVGLNTGAKVRRESASTQSSSIGAFVLLGVIVAVMLAFRRKKPQTEFELLRDLEAGPQDDFKAH